MTRLPLIVSCFWICACGAGSTTRPLDTWTDPASGMRFVRVPAGTFMMGSPATEPRREEQERQHVVTLSHPFWIGAYEVTQRQWESVMNANPSRFEGADRPVETITWNDVQDFLARLNARTIGSRFRLPTEAEWEYACRAGSRAPYATGDRLTPDAANIAASTARAAAGDGSTRAVGSYPPNAWGLYDMHGNVWEWISDEHCPYQEGTATDPGVAACGSPLKVIRGGSWYFEADSARCATRYTHPPGERGFSLGVRLVRDALD